MGDTATCACDGSGKIEFHHVDRDDAGNTVGRTWGSHLCPCRASLPPRDGEARWWSTERAHSEVFAGTLFTAEVVVNAEVPISEDNYRLHLEGNRYYPTSIDLELDRDAAHFIHADEAREFAAFWQRAIDAAEKIDGPCTAPCGHWTGCDCPAGDEGGTGR